jgi:hypothetical protein
MAEYIGVYFAPDGKWFMTREACERYENVVEISKY